MIKVHLPNNKILDEDWCYMPEFNQEFFYRYCRHIIYAIIVEKTEDGKEVWLEFPDGD